MSYPDRVLDEPDLPVQLPALPAHQVSLLIRGLDARLATLGRLRDLGVLHPEAYAERAEPAKAARARLAELLASWCRGHGHVRVAGDDQVGAPPTLWPTDADAGPVNIPAMPLAEVFELRLGAEFAAYAEFDRLGEESPKDAPERFAELAAVQRAVIEAMAAHGVEAD